MAKQVNVKMPKVVSLSKDGRYQVNPKDVRIIPKYNVRDAFDPDLNVNDAALVASMVAIGYQADKPITVRVGSDGNLYVIAGHRRVAAALLANVPYVTLIPEALNEHGEYRNAAEMLLDIYTSNSGEPLAEHEKGEVFARLEAGGMTVEEIARRCGIATVAWVRKLIKAAKADPEVKAILKAGWIAPTVLVLLQGAHGVEKAGTIIKEAKKRAVRAGRTKVSAAQDLAPVEEEETGTTKVSGKNKGKAGTPPVVAEPPVTIVPEVPHVMPIVAGVPQGGPFHLGKGQAKCDLFDASGRSLGAFDNETDAKQLLILINTGWNALAPKASVVPDVEPVKAVPPAVTVPELTKAQEKAAAKARLKTAMDKATAEKERQAGVAARVAAHETAEAERHAAALAAEAEAAQAARKPRGKPVVPVAVMVAASAVSTGSKGRGNVGQALTQAAPARRAARGH